MKTSIIIGLLFGMACLAACGDDDDSDRLSGTDQEFIRSAAMANIAEIDAGELAVSKTSDEGVRGFAEHMVSEHTTAWRDLEDLADKKNVDLPGDTDEAHRRKREQLAALTGYAFDTAYVNSQVKDHQVAIALFERARDRGSNTDVKGYAVNYLPHLQEHLEQALDLKAELDGNPPTNPDGRN